MLDTASRPRHGFRGLDFSRRRRRPRMAFVSSRGHHVHLGPLPDTTLRGSRAKRLADPSIVGGGRHYRTGGRLRVNFPAPVLRRVRLVPGSPSGRTRCLWRALPNGPLAVQRGVQSTKYSVDLQQRDLIASYEVSGMDLTHSETTFMHVFKSLRQCPRAVIKMHDRQLKLHAAQAAH